MTKYSDKVCWLTPFLKASKWTTSPFIKSKGEVSKHFTKIMIFDNPIWQLCLREILHRPEEVLRDQSDVLVTKKAEPPNERSFGMLMLFFVKLSFLIIIFTRCFFLYSPHCFWKLKNHDRPFSIARQVCTNESLKLSYTISRLHI